MRKRKTDRTVDRSDAEYRQLKKARRDLKLHSTIKDLLEQANTDGDIVEGLMTETDSLAILNRAKVNNFLNSYLTKVFDSIDGVAQVNNRLLNKITRRKEVIDPKDYVRMYIKGRELENEQLRLVTEFTKCQEVKLDLEEQNIIIIYRSLPKHLKRILYKTIMEFVRQCPAMQREIQVQHEKVENLPQE